ncbi:sacsin [Aulostomus maculatus]
MSLKKKKSRTSFGATAPPFIDYLKDILRRYPDGGQILKELIQNADDAQATKVMFIHDERGYRTESLWTEELRKYQGPALYAYNNAEFTDDDWGGIQAAGRSVKRNDPNKVGRFGIGFNSIYHITDVPSIFSSGHLGLLDPQEKIFGERNGGFLWSLDDEEHQEALTNMHDQFQPFRDIVSLVSEREWSKIIMEDQRFEGTIFRFPLRNEASDISDNLYNANRVVQLFESFNDDAEMSLLFMKNVTTVTLIHIDAHGSVNTRLEVRSSVSTDVILKSEDESMVESATRFKQITLNSDKRRETKWLVTTCTMKEGNVETLDSLAKKLSFFPQVDLAFPCGEKPDCSKSRLSCFLPLPNNEANKTGLPVCVNACFGLTDNRRHIKWQEEDQKHDEHAMWNELLMKEVLPQAYLTIIQDAVRLAQRAILPVCSIYDLWPDVAQIQHKEKWFDIARDVLLHLFKDNMAILSLVKDERKFIPLKEAVLPCNGPTSLEILAAIERTLVACGENLVTLPSNVARAINKAYPDLSALKQVTPAFLRDVLRRVGVKNISKNDKLCLLEYLLSDGQYTELQGLQLLPLSDGSFRSFTDREEDTALIDSKEFPRVLLPGCQHLFIPDDLNPACSTHLKNLSRKKLFKVIDLDADQVVEYVKRYLPEDWKQMKAGHVTWDIRNTQHPPLVWLQEFWKFLNTHFTELRRFLNLPLIPVSPLSVSQPVLLARVQQNPTLIFQRSKQVRLPEQVAQLINKINGTVVRGNEWLKHEDLDSYVLGPSPRSVVKIFMNMEGQHVNRKLESASHSEREELKDYLSRLDSLSVNEKNLLSKAPLFQNFKGSHVTAWSKQAVVVGSNGLTIPAELPMPDSVVQCASEADRRLLQLLQIQLLDTAQAAIRLIDSIEKGTCSQGDSKKIMTWVLQHGNILFSQNPTLKDKCKDLRYIDVGGGLKKTSSFFDPRIETFKVLFESDYFPPSLYSSTSQMLESLTLLGLLNKAADMSPEHLLHAATLIDRQHVASKNESLKRAQVLIKLLVSHDLLSKFSQEQLNGLKTLKWIPCTKPGHAKRQGNEKPQSNFFCPDEIRHSTYEDIVGDVMPLMGKLSDKVSKKLGLMGLPPPEKVIENLSVLKSKAQKMADPETNADFKRKLQSIYKHMQDNISAFSTKMKKDTCFLWNHNQFVSPQDLILDYPPNLDLSAYIGKVPKEFLPYKKLFREFGLRMSLSDEEIVGILHSIKKNIEERKQSFANSTEIKVSIEILIWLWREKKTVQDDIPVPVIIKDGHYTLKPLSAAIFCDVNKMGLEELKNKEEIHIIHEEIPKATAEWLNVPLLSTHILEPEFVGIEQCGQSEPITMRIKNILKEYDEESDIFKELIQNAEDAGAEVCKFLVDFRVHKDAPDSLIDPDMALCQGPCLWAFNNEQFTDRDWKNIVRVGSASKENQVEKIGKFGLGFNTVYHVTDIPSVLSGNSLLILDPNVTHLKKHIKHTTDPGIKLDLSKKHLFHCFPGQFRPYECICDCNFTQQGPSGPYQGTLIKLPFRTEEEALLSEISNKVYDKHSIVSFQNHLTDSSQTHLLFLKNINTLSLQKIPSTVQTPPRSGEIQNVFTASKTTLSTMGLPDDTCVSQQRRAEKLLMKIDGKCKDVIDCNTVSIVQVTSLQSGETQVQSWLLYNCFGTDQSLKMALKDSKQAQFSLPIGGIAVPLQKNPKSEKLAASETKLSGHAFCFLPLSIQTGLPVNVNGTFAVTSNRKGLWESGVKHEWNKALLQDPVVTAYVTALSTLKKMSEKEQLESYCYHTFWPDREKVSDTFKPVVDKFYSTIAENTSAPELCSDGKHWCSMNNAIFLHESIEKDKINKLAMEVCRKYTKEPNLVVPLPLWLRNSFKQAGLERVLQDRTWNWEKFYQEAVFNNLATMDHTSRDALLLHAIDLNKKELDNLLVQYPCIPTTDGQLQYINKLVSPSGKVACLFDKEEGRLLGGTKHDFCSLKRIQRLLELGMNGDSLPLEDIAKKASTISSTWSTDKTKAYVHLRCLLELMKNHMHNQDVLWETLKITEFLPAFPPGDTKMERQVTLRRPTDVFKDECSLLVNMTQPVLDQSSLKIHSTDLLLQKLGVRDNPGPEMVLQQLQKAQQQSQSIDKSVLQKIALECYRCLDQWLRDSVDSTFISQEANLFPFILVGSAFVNVNHVAVNEQFEVKPYLHVLPSAFANFKNLWESIGVEKHFTVTQYLTVLQELHLKHKDQPLPKSDLAICLTILTRGLFYAGEKTSDCLIPNDRGVLQPASQLFFDDSPWMPVTSGNTLCHENIPRVMALHFGIKTTRHHTLQSHVAENISPFAFHFGQQEQLPVRIRGIISAYPSKKDILKELIQNADDAEATEIHFVWDKRQHGNEKIFGEKWKSLQGPALCVFNNKVFSDADLNGIQQLGEGGKHNAPGKIGKYGVGFNSVYHLTDCPSILTGDDKLCVSDPNQNYIESNSDERPNGIGYNLADTLKEMYMDVYKSFLPDKFPLKEGTMFRLPLRTGTMAESSKISQQEVTAHDMKELCSVLSEDPEGLILFLKNICKIEIHEISEHSGELESIFAVEKSTSPTSREEKASFEKLLQNALQTDKPVTPHKAIYGAAITTSDQQQSRWVILEQFGACTNSGDKANKSDKLPQAAIAARVMSKPAPKLLDHSSFNGQAFCSLPLPGNTGLPVHVNGNFEVDSARRNLWRQDGTSQKSQWNEYLKQDVLAPLYADLLHYLSQNIKKKKIRYSHIESFLNERYLCFWPTVSEAVSQDWHAMIQEVYRSINQRGLTVIPVLRTSVAVTAEVQLKEYSFDLCDIKETNQTETPYLLDSMDSIRHILEDIGMKLVPFSRKMHQVWQGFKSADIKVKDVTPSTVRAFLREKPLNDPMKTNENLPVPIADTLIRDQMRCSQLLRFCLKDIKVDKITKDDSGVLNGLPLLLTTDQVLRVFDTSSPKLISKYSSLFSGFEEEFAEYSTNFEHIIELRTFQLVQNLTVPTSVKFLKPLIQHHLQSCDLDPHQGFHVLSDQMLTWLKSLWRFLISEMRLTTSADDQQNLTLSVVRQLFSDCCILPTLCPKLENKHFLRKMEEMSSVIQFTTETSSILFKLGFMKLDGAFFLDMDRQIQLHFQPELMDTNDKCAVLDQLFTRNNSDFSLLLSEEDMRNLQTFLQSGVPNFSTNHDYQRKLKSLPLFETIHSERVRIDGLEEVVILNVSAKSLAAFPDLFTLPNSNSIFLKNNHENCGVSQILSIPVLTDLEYFIKFILPAVQRLTEKQKLHCIKLLLSLQNHDNYLKHKDNIIHALKPVKLFCNSEGSFETASYYFDDSVELYTVMLPEEKFVSKKLLKELCGEDVFKRLELKNLLLALGMKHDVTKDEIVQFAKQIESEAKRNCPLKEMKQKSKIVFKAALTAAHNDKTQVHWLRNIANIEFIFPVDIKRELCDYHQPFASKTTAIKIRGSLIESDPQHQELVWSSVPIIHLPGSKPEKFLNILKDAGALEKPLPQSVTMNMRNICQSPCQSETQIRTRANVFRRAYDFLQSNEFDSQTLNGLPVVLVEDNKKLVRSDVVCVSLPDHLEFRPYLYKIPPKIAIFEEFFKKLGVKEEPSAVQLCNALAAVHADSCDKGELNPNQLKTVKCAVQHFFLSIKSQKKKPLLDDVTTLYLPAINGKLNASCALYYNDTTFETKRFEVALPENILLLGKLSECYLGYDKYVHHRLLQMLPPKLQPKMLSQVTEEKVVESQMQPCEFGTDCNFSGWFEKSLSSRAFRHGLICLIRAQSVGKVTLEDASDMCAKTFGRIQIVCCKSLATELWLDKQPLNDTAAETDVYVKRGQRGCVFYLKHNSDKDYEVLNEVNLTLTKEINGLLENRFESTHLPILGQLLMCKDLCGVQRILAKNNIHDNAEDDTISFGPPAPGTDVQDDWLDSLDMNVLNNFEEGEYVGYSTDDKYIYAIIVEKLPGISGLYSQRYKIQVREDEEIEVSCLDLYQIRCDKKQKSQQDTPFEPACMELELLVGAQSDSSQPSMRSSPASLEEAKQEIDECLAEIWHLSEVERKKAIKRLYLRWHPDKNLDRPSIATAVCQYLQKRVDKLNTGETNGSSHPKGKSNFRDFYQQWDDEASHHRQSRERFYERHQSYNFWNHYEDVPRPNKKEAQRWCRQARCDLNAACKDTDGGSTEWCLFKVHQAVEKSLIAAEYKKRGHYQANSSITTMADKVSIYSLELRGLPKIVASLRQLGVDAKKTQYPTSCASPYIPNDTFTLENARQAMAEAAELLSRVQNYVN